jgi:hypothetical protein
MRINHVLCIVAMLVVNSGWYVVSQQSASQEINRPGAEFSESRDAELTSIIGDESEYELEYCFDSINGAVHNVSIEVMQDSETLFSWNGTTDGECMNHSSTTDEGEIVIITYAEDGVEVTTNLRTWPMKSALLPGIVIFSIATLVVAFAENVIRGVIKNRVKKPIDSSDVKPSESPVVTSGIWQEPVRPE